MTLATRAGGLADPAGKEGVANLVMRTIDRGTKTRTAIQIEDELGDLGTGLSGGAGRETSQLGLDVLKTNLDAAMAVMADVVLHPIFPQSEFDRERRLQLDTLSQQSKDANALVGRIRPMLVFGATHPYGRPVSGLPSTVNSITRDDLVKAHAASWKPGSSAVVFAGDISLDGAKQLAQKSFGAWAGGAAPAVDIPAPQPAGGGLIYLVDRPDAAQTAIAQALAGPVRTAEDFYAFHLVDAVWGGGGFGTRLNLNLREDKGYSYGIFSNEILYSRGTDLDGRRWRSDQQDEGIGDGIRQRAAGDRRQAADHGGGARLGEAGARAWLCAAVRVARTDRGSGRPVPGLSACP